MKNTRQPIRQDDQSIVAAVHRAGRRVRALIARLPESGNGKSKRPTVIAAREFAPGEASAINGWIEAHRAGVILSVLPAGSVICRTCTLPDVPEEQLEPALRLQAEAHLLGLAPAHRLGMAILDQAPGETSRTGLILAWPESADVETSPVEADETRHVHYVPDIAAIAALINGDRPTHPLLYVDHHYGSVAMAITHAGGVVFRGLRDDPRDAAAWREAVVRALAESSLNAGHTPAFIEALVQTTTSQLEAVESDEARLILPSGLLQTMRARIADAPEDEEWWVRFGVAAGAVVARAGALAPLTRLEREVPIRSPSLVDRVVATLSTPAAAGWAVAACIVVLIFGPLMVSGLRLGVLSLRHSSLPEQVRAVNDVRNKLVVYRELNQNSWPMTKMLADIACNTPEGIELEQVRITPNRMFTVTGRAIPAGSRSATEVVSLMQEFLHQSGIFNEITLNWGDSDSFGHYSFELTARLHRPYFKHDYPDELDFGKYTMVDRRDGKMPGRDVDNALAMDTGDRGAEARSALPPTVVRDNGDDEFRVPSGRSVATRADQQADRIASAGKPDDTKPSTDENGRQLAIGPETSEDNGSRTPGSRIDRPRASDASPFGGAGMRGDSRSDVAAPPSEQIPEPLSEQQINAMSISEVRESLLKVSTARRYARHRNDVELQERLEREFKWLMDRMRQSGGGS